MYLGPAQRENLAMVVGENLVDNTTNRQDPSLPSVNPSTNL